MPPTSLREPSANSEGWFDELPEDHRQRILAEDAAHLDRWAEVARLDARSWRKPARQGALLFAFIGAYVTGLAGLPILASALGGALCGWIWDRTRAGQVLAPFIAVPLFLAGLGLSGGMSIAALIWAPIPISVVSIWLGMRRHELQGS